MFTAIKNNKIIAYNETGKFPCLVYDRIEEVEDAEMVEVGGEFVLKTDDKAIKQKNKERVAELKKFLADTDYSILKIEEAIDEAEKQDLREKYADVIKARREARIEINKLEK
jgi:hypothetical protein